MNKIIEKCDVCINGSVVSKELLIKTFSSFVSSTIEDKQHNVGIVFTRDQFALMQFFCHLQQYQMCCITKQTPPILFSRFRLMTWYYVMTAIQETASR